MSSLERGRDVVFPIWKIALPRTLAQKTMRLLSCAVQLRKAVHLPRPAGFITFLATGEFVKFNSLNNKITSLCGTH